jgi:hypothetical protein
MHTPGDYPSATVHPAVKIARGPPVQPLPASNMDPAWITRRTLSLSMTEHRAWDMWLSIERARTSVKLARVRSHLLAVRPNSSRRPLLIRIDKPHILYHPYILHQLALLLDFDFFDSFRQKPPHLHRVNDSPFLINSVLMSFIYFYFFFFSKTLLLQSPFCEAFQGVTFRELQKPEYFQPVAVSLAPCENILHGLWEFFLVA